VKVRNGGRGGIRTHGGFPHARFRVECLKPDSATLPIARHCRSYFRMRNSQTVLAFAKAKHDTSVSMARCTDRGIETWIIYKFRRPIGDFEAYNLVADELWRRSRDSGGCYGTDEGYIDASGQSGCWVVWVMLPEAKNVTILGLPCPDRGLHIVCPKDSHAITCCSLGFTGCLRRCSPVFAPY
jgi:hypothetical protein